MENQSLYYIEISGGECGASSGRILLVLADQSTAKMTKIFDKEIYANDSGEYHNIAIFTTRPEWNYQVKYHVTDHYNIMTDEPYIIERLPPNSVLTKSKNSNTKKYLNSKYIFIKEEKAESLLDKNGDFVYSEDDAIQSKITDRKESWYEIDGNKLIKLK